jgi:tRNA modification GTPase
MSSTTRIAVLTPPGTSAVATIAIVGANAWTLIRSAFRRVNGQQLPPEPVLLSHWAGEFGQPPADAVVLSVRRALPLPWIEIHCHGGSQAVCWLVEEIRALGAEICTWQQIIRDSDPSPLRTEAAIELTRTVTLRTAAILLDQHQGSLDAELAAISTLMEGQSELAYERLVKLLRFADLGRRLSCPWRVAIAGPANVGKSSLINRLVGYPRCVVAPIPGTTRDVVATSIAIDGWPVELLDTAGQRETTDALEKAGISLAAETARDADLTVWLLDVADTAPAPINISPGILLVRNKIDLVPQWPNRDAAICISALTGQGLDNLLAIISRRLVPDAPPPGAAVPFSSAIVDRLTMVANLCAADEIRAAQVELRTLMTGQSTRNVSNNPLAS